MEESVSFLNLEMGYKASGPCGAEGRRVKNEMTSGKQKHVASDVDLLTNSY
jgi:hypothetical protein